MSSRGAFLPYLEVGLEEELRPFQAEVAVAEHLPYLVGGVVVEHLLVLAIQVNLQVVVEEHLPSLVNLLEEVEVRLLDLAILQAEVVEHLPFLVDLLVVAEEHLEVQVAWVSQAILQEVEEVFQAVPREEVEGCLTCLAGREGLECRGVLPVGVEGCLEDRLGVGVEYLKFQGGSEEQGYLVVHLEEVEVYQIFQEDLAELEYQEVLPEEAVEFHPFEEVQANLQEVVEEYPRFQVAKEELEYLVEAQVVAVGYLVDQEAEVELHQVFLLEMVIDYRQPVPPEVQFQ